MGEELSSNKKGGKAVLVAASFSPKESGKVAEYLDELEFLVAYFYDIVVYSTLAFLLTLLIKKSGFVIISLFLYTIMFEPILTAVVENHSEFRDGILPILAQYLPIKSLNNLIPLPFGKYIFREIEDNVSWRAILISTGWLVIFLSSISFILNKRDLK